MKILEKEVEFKPVTITLESELEVLVLEGLVRLADDIGISEFNASNLIRVMNANYISLKRMQIRLIVKDLQTSLAKITNNVYDRSR